MKIANVMISSVDVSNNCSPNGMFETILKPLADCTVFKTKFVPIIFIASINIETVSKSHGQSSKVMR